MHYLIQFKWYQPYPKEYEVREKGSNSSVAVSRAIKFWRKEVVPRKKINEFYLKITKI